MFKINPIKRSLITALTLTSVGLLSSTSAHADDPIKIVFWHSMEGALGSTLKGLVNDFNEKNPEYKVDPIYKGNYYESMNASIAAYRAKQAPDIAQVFEVGTATMMNSGGAIKPIQEMSEEVGDPIDPDKFLGAVAGYYASNEGKLVSMPFNSSSAVLYYNKDLYKKAGLDPEKPPKTYEDLKSDLTQLKEAGVDCGYTTSWPAWVLMETATAWHNVPYATEDNGFGGLSARLNAGENEFLLRLFNDLAEMSKEGTFTYNGRADSAISPFIAGKCAVFTGSSGTRAQLESSAKFEYGISQLPYYDDIEGAPQNSIIGGASLWVFNGKEKPVYEGITKFFHYLSSPEVAAQWHQETGYAPVVKAAYDLTKEQGFYDKNPGTDVVVKQLDADTTEASRGVRLGSLPDIRDVEEGIMEEIFNGKQSPEAGLKAMQKKGNEILKRFEKSHQ